ncbi:alpha/beta hydrolase [Mucilaginibacter achroorhodeus]|uniref:Alpha/beta hydrolase n=1 Tax=Mucilaginibacter achroorhodeus TaxID=2599294 RepID=A0A563U9M9_9SPHI|nr:alpha/beta hydrolase [Mucilaginibacter achroorhodeus]TWR28048.1 alpha/beta hydrolase [Mucilaginibacter achroorhodeus]
MKTNLLLLAAGVCMSVAACTSNGSKKAADSSAKGDTAAMAATDTTKALKPAGPAPSWAPTMKPEMQVVIEKLASYGDKPIPELTAVEARKNHTPTDAVMDVMKEHGIAKPVFNVDTMGKDIPVDGGTIHLRVYTPKTNASSYPVIVYYHGGGFVIANLDVYDASANVLADKTGAIVVSVAYRLAPEHKFPVAHNDAYAAYKWVVNNAASIKGDAKKIAVAGESAGGNLAIATAIKARDSKTMVPTAILAVYPVAQSDMNTTSYIKYGNAKPLDKAMMGWFVKNYLNSMAEAKDPRISLVTANLKGLPPTTVINAEIDPLQSDGMMIVDKLKAAGVTVDSKKYDGVTHEFFGMGAVVPEAKDAEEYAVAQLKKAFGM